MPRHQINMYKKEQIGRKKIGCCFTQLKMHSKKEIKITCFHDYDRATVVTRHLGRHILLRFLAKFNINIGDNEKIN